MIDITKLKLGDIVQNKGSGSGYVVNRITVSPFKVFATREIEISNPTEWDLDENEKRLPCGHDKKNTISVSTRIEMPRSVYCKECGERILNEIS